MIMTATPTTEHVLGPVLLACLASFLLQSHEAAETCHEANECQYDSISGDGVECYGYNACSHATLIESTTASKILCRGSFSCYNVELIEHTSSFTGIITCAALYSCASSKMINQFGHLTCSAEQSCYDSVSNVVGHIACYAWRSCAASNLTSDERFELNGALDAQNSVLRASSDSVIFYFRGHESGHGAHIICQSACTIYCFSDACNNLITSCLTGGDCFTIVCESVTKSTLCPDGYDLPAAYEFPSLANTNFSTLESANITCNNKVTNALTCDAFYDSTCSEINTNNNGKLSTESDIAPICCSGGYSCQSLGDITAVVNVSDSLVYDTAFRADGAYAWDGLTGTLSAPNGGDMFFAARAEDDSIVIQGSGSNDIIASAAYGVNSKIINMIANLYCLGWNACQYADVTDVKNNIFAYSNRALYYASVSNVGGNIYCNAHQGCYEMAVSNVEGDIITLGYQVLYGAEVSNVTGTLLAYGTESLASARVQNVARMEINGADALIGSEIWSLSQTNQFVLVINGSNSANYDVYCSATDTCIIRCQSADACTTMSLFCDGVCYIDCDESVDNFGCPSISGSGNWSDWISNDTTMVSTQPSNMPSNMPSIAPTFDPKAGTDTTTAPSDTKIDYTTTVDDDFQISSTTTTSKVFSSSFSEEVDATKKSDNTADLIYIVLGISTVVVLFFICGVVCYNKNCYKKCFENKDEDTAVVVADPKASAKSKDASKDASKAPDATQSARVELQVAHIKSDETDETDVVVQYVNQSNNSPGENAKSKEKNNVKIDGVSQQQDEIMTEMIQIEGLESTTTIGAVISNPSVETPIGRIVDWRDWQEWSRDQVNEWIQDVLKTDGFEQDQIDTFISKIFAPLQINGKILLKIKMNSNEKLLEQFQTKIEKFSFGMWVTLSSALDNLHV